MFLNLFGSPSPKKRFNEGLDAYRKGDAEKAVARLSEAIKLEKQKKNPDRKFLSDIYNVKGEVYLSVGVAILSQSDFAQALDYNPTNENALNNFGVWFSIEQFTTPDYRKSIEYLDRALALRPDRKDIALNRAVIKIKSGDRTGCDDLKKLDEERYPDAKIALRQFCNEP